MQRHHKTVQIRITLSSNSDYKERHILDNMNVYGVECNHLIAKTFKKTYNLKYTCTDGAGHSDTELQRVTIKDTTPPTIAFKMSYVLQTTSEVAHKGYKGTLDSGYIHLGGHPDTSIAASQMAAFTCDDLCTGSCAAKKTKIARSHKWVKTCGSDTLGLFNTLIPGTYYHKFTCTDCNGLTTSKCRTVINEDSHKPIIQVLGKEPVDRITIEATHDSNYVDAGATCFDHVDKWISDKVEVSGDVVNLAKPDTYTITYKCQDMAGNKADDMTRLVHVVDTTCPTCAFNKPSNKNAKKFEVFSHEASFKYTDAGVTCTDTLDGSMKVTTKGKPVNSELTGKYYTTYSTTDMAGNSNVNKKGGKKCGKALVRTVKVVDTLKPVIALHWQGKKIHETGAADTGIDNQRNPAQDKWMAETSSVNGWIVAAVASAVAGVAILALGSKTTATSVPV